MVDMPSGIDYVEHPIPASRPQPVGRGPWPVLSSRMDLHLMERSMTALIRRAGVLVALSLVLLPRAARGKELSKVAVARLGKPATALVEVKGKGTGSAFCIHPSGLFLTNEHVVRGAAETVTLVLNSGLKTQKVLSARVVRIDPELDLALLRAEGDSKYPALTLGSDEDLAELTDLVAFGFPFGKQLTFEKDSFPSVSVNAGTVTSLRRKRGVLSRIQMDAGVNPGCSGGPVLDMTGKVIGVVVSGVRTTSVNFAIPVSHVSRFVARPDIQFTPPALDHSALHRPVPFQVRAVSLLPTAKPLALELVVKSAAGERAYPMQRAGASYRATAPAVPRPENPVRLRLVAGYAERVVEGLVEECGFRVGESAVKLSEVRRLYGGPKPRVLLANGKTLAGALAGLDAVPVRGEKQTLTLNLARASEATVESAAETPWVSFTIVARQDGKEVGRVSTTTTIQNADRKGAGIQAPVLTGDKVVLNLPGPVADVAVGGGGRFLILHLPRQGRLTVFDVNRGRLTHSVPAADDVKFSAGLHHLVVVSPGQHLLRRYSLYSLEQEQSTPLPFRGVVTTVALGSASNGPLLVRWAVGTQPLDRAFCTLFDLATLKPLPARQVGIQLGGHGMCYRDNIHVRAAPDGTVFGLWCTSHTPTGLQTLVVRGGEVKFTYEHTSVGAVVPGPGGKVLFTAAGLYSADLRKQQSPRPDGCAYLPAQEGPYYLAWPALLNQFMAGPRPQERPPAKVAVYSVHNDQLVATLTDLEPPGRVDGPIKGDFTYDKRVHFIPAADLIVTIPASDDRLVLHRFRVEEALSKIGLRVTSLPPGRAKPEDTYRYQVVARSRNGGVQYQLAFGPPGMTISERGLIEWKVPRHLGAAECAALVRVRDAAAQECEHRFQVQVEESAPLVSINLGTSWGTQFSADGRRLAGVSPDGFRVWEVKTGRLIRHFAVRPLGFSLLLSPDGRFLAGNTVDGFKVWNVKTGRDTFQLKGQLLNPTFSPNGKWLGAVLPRTNFANPPELRIWDAATGREIATLKGEPRTFPTALLFCPDGKHVAAAFGNKVHLWNATSGETVGESRPLSVSLLSFSNDGKRLAAVSQDTVTLFSTRTGKEVLSFKAGGPVQYLAHSPDGKRLLCRTFNGLAAYDAGTGKEVFRVRSDHQFGMARAVFSPDGKFLVMTSPQGVDLWDAAAGALVVRWKALNVADCLLVRPEGKLLAVLGRDRTVRVWELTP
jgi:WD40 repeat protein